MAVADLPAVTALHDQVFGPGALTRAAYRVREGQPHLTTYCRVLCDGATVIAAIKYTAIKIGGRSDALMLGPLMVAAHYGNQGHGRRLISESLKAAREGGIQLVLLVGDAPYYARFGFQPVLPMGRIEMPGPVDPRRLLVTGPDVAVVAEYAGMVRGAD
jgi:predicted N-acetyltransferase YhbS